MREKTEPMSSGQTPAVRPFLSIAGRNGGLIGVANLNRKVRQFVRVEGRTKLDVVMATATTGETVAIGPVEGVTGNAVPSVLESMNLFGGEPKSVEYSKTEPLSSQEVGKTAISANGDVVNAKTEEQAKASPQGLNLAATLQTEQAPQATEAKPVAEQAIKQEAITTSEEAAKLDEDQKIQLNDGTVTTVGELRLGNHKGEYDRRVWQLKSRERELEQREAALATKEQSIESQQATLKALYGDTFASVYTTARLQGASQEQAMRAGAVAANMNLPETAASQPQGKPQPGTREFYLQTPEEAGINPDTNPSEYGAHWLKHVEANAVVKAEKAAEDKFAQLKAGLDADRAKESQSIIESRRIEEGRQKIAAHNIEMLGLIDGELIRKTGINSETLDDQKRTMLQTMLTQSAVEAGYKINDREWLMTNALGPQQVKEIVGRLSVNPKDFQPSVSNMQAQQQVTPELPRTPTVQNRPIGAGGPSTASTAAGTKTPLSSMSAEEKTRASNEQMWEAMGMK